MNNHIEGDGSLLAEKKKEEEEARRLKKKAKASTKPDVKPAPKETDGNSYDRGNTDKEAQEN